jgi:hypothetical protein
MDGGLWGANVGLHGSFQVAKFTGDRGVGNGVAEDCILRGLPQTVKTGGILAIGKDHEQRVLLRDGALPSQSVQDSCTQNSTSEESS